MEGWGGVHYEGVGWLCYVGGGVGCVMEEEPVMEGWGLSCRGGGGSYTGVVWGGS